MQILRRAVGAAAVMGISITGLMFAACEAAPPEDDPSPPATLAPSPRPALAAAAAPCSCSNPPCACDDGQGSTCPNPGGSVTLHHLTTFVTGADPLGACVAVVAPVAG